MKNLLQKLQRFSVFLGVFVDWTLQLVLPSPKLTHVYSRLPLAISYADSYTQCAQCPGARKKERKKKSWRWKLQDPKALISSSSFVKSRLRSVIFWVLCLLVFSLFLFWKFVQGGLFTTFNHFLYSLLSQCFLIHY